MSSMIARFWRLEWADRRHWPMCLANCLLALAILAALSTAPLAAVPSPGDSASSIGTAVPAVVSARGASGAETAQSTDLKGSICARIGGLCGVAKRLYWSVNETISNFWPMWPINFVVAFAIVLTGFQASRRLNAADTLRYILPRKMYLSRSAITDYKYFISISLVKVFVPFFTIFVSSLFIAEYFSSALKFVFGPTDPAESVGIAARLAYTAGVVLAIDLGWYISHYLLHKVPLLWEFHKVHHSAQELIPFSASRMHIVDLMLSDLFIGITVGLFNGFFLYHFDAPLELVTIFSTSFVLFLYGITSVLRHSHIWLHYGWHLSHILSSPAQHQIHHSNSPRHYDTNYGRVFSVWDWVMGTLYVPRARETISFGLADGEDNEYQSMWGCYVLPFVKAARLARAGWRLPARPIADRRAD